MVGFNLQVANLTEAKSHLAVIGIVSDNHQNSRLAALFGQPLHQFDAFDVRHQDIQHDHARIGFLICVLEEVGIGQGRDFITDAFRSTLYEICEIRFIIHDKQSLQTY